MLLSVCLSVCRQYIAGVHKLSTPFLTEFLFSITWGGPFEKPLFKIFPWARPPPRGGGRVFSHSAGSIDETTGGVSSSPRPPV